MINLSKPPCDEFAVDPHEYSTRPSGFTLSRLRYLEENIRERSLDFLQDPQYFIQEWEDITDECIPEQYVKGIPEKIVAFLIRGKNKSIGNKYIVELLPTFNADGTPKTYPDDRLVAEALAFNQKVYILDDSILKQLTKK